MLEISWSVLISCLLCNKILFLLMSSLLGKQLKNMLVESCQSVIEQNNTEKQGENVRRKTGELLGHFPSKIRFVFRRKTFSKNDAETQN